MISVTEPAVTLKQMRMRRRAAAAAPLTLRARCGKQLAGGHVTQTYHDVIATLHDTASLIVPAGAVLGVDTTWKKKKKEDF